MQGFSGQPLIHHNPLRQSLAIVFYVADSSSYYR